MLNLLTLVGQVENKLFLCQVVSDMFSLFKKKRPQKFSVHITGNSVFYEQFVPYTEFTANELDAADEAMRDAIQKTISAETWDMLDQSPQQGRPEIYQYAESVVEQLLLEFNLDRDSVSVDDYQFGLVIIAVRTNDPRRLPFYFQGIRIKAFLPLPQEFTQTAPDLP